MPIIQFKDIFKGGLADSKYVGVANSMAEMVGLDIHSEPGIIKVNQALAKDSGATVTEAIAKIVTASDGSSYLFSSGSGKIWKRTAGGAYSLAHTNTDGANVDADEYEGYIYYASATKLGRFQIGGAWTDTWATFTNGDTDFHPMKVKNGILYIGDGDLIAQVDAGVFTADALDLPKPHRVKCLGEVYTDLLIGTYISANCNLVSIFRWDTWSISWTVDDVVPEIGLNAVLPLDNYAVIQAGTKGRIYIYNGSQLELFKRIPGDWSDTNKALVNPNAAAVFDRPLFGLSNSSGNPAPQGVYSFGSYSSNYPKILNLEYVISQGVTAGVSVGAMANIGDNILVAWNVGANYGVDKIDWSNKYNGAYLKTRLIAIDRELGKDFRVMIPYRSIPTGTSLTVKYYENYASSPTTLTMTQDTDRKILYGEAKIPKANTLQLEVIFNTSANNAPEIESLEISY